MGTAEHPIDKSPRFAIVGYARRAFPAHRTPTRSGRYCARAADAVSEIPEDRWDVDEFFDPEPGVPGKVVTRRAGFRRRRDRVRRAVLRPVDARGSG